ncbi:MAG: hypothetical protein H0V70_17415 [Ktedonobacteraceae bacterium]|nr:hypothetical protein [Ktedonobacteraceae bacterium]
MLLFLTALAPIKKRWRQQILAVAALPVSCSQGITIIVLLSDKLTNREKD